MVLDVWSEFKLLVEQVEEDVHKNAVKGNLSAGVRVRKGVRRLRVLGAELIKATHAARDEAKGVVVAVAPPAEVEPELAKPTKKGKKTG
jgi:hypothetical protein